jgi:hypothetical protein
MGNDDCNTKTAHAKFHEILSVVLNVAKYPLQHSQRPRDAENVSLHDKISQV